MVGEINPRYYPTNGSFVVMNVMRMKNLIVALLAFSCLLSCSSPQPPRQKVIDEGGLGKYPSVVTEDAAFKGYTIYRPADIQQAIAQGPLPLVVFGNGGCMNTSVYFERFLSEIASFGYVVIAVGPYHETIEEAQADEDAAEWTDYHLLTDAMDLMQKAVKDEKSIFYKAVDMNKVAVMGQSCGGLQALAVSGDTRVKTTICLNSGVITPTEEQIQRNLNLVIDKSALNKLHAPILYLVGGRTDTAYENAMDDFLRIDNVFAVIASDQSGHMGTYAEEFGGAYGQIALRWLEWHLHEEEWAESVFIGEECICAYPGWDAQFKNIEKLTLP